MTRRLERRVVFLPFTNQLYERYGNAPFTYIDQKQKAPILLSVGAFLASSSLGF